MMKATITSVTIQQPHLPIQILGRPRVEVAQQKLITEMTLQAVGDSTEFLKNSGVVYVLTAEEYERYLVDIILE